MPPPDRIGSVLNWYVLFVVLMLGGELLGLAGLQLAEPAAGWLEVGGALVAVALIMGGVATVLLDWLLLDRLRRMSRESTELRDQAIAGQALRATLATRGEQLRRLRHDLRGALSPALLVADRLVNHPDPSVQRSGQIMMRTVERATALLADQDAAAPAEE